MSRHAEVRDVARQSHPNHNPKSLDFGLLTTHCAGYNGVVCLLSASSFRKNGIIRVNGVVSGRTARHQKKAEFCVESSLCRGISSLEPGAQGYETRRDRVCSIVGMLRDALHAVLQLVL
jgi:hypothetical protein